MVSNCSHGSPFRRRRIPALLIVSCLLVAHSAAAQATVSVNGVVKDASGGVLTDVAIDIVIAGRTVASVRTGSDGQYRVEIPAGVPAELQLRRDGFADRIVALAGTDISVARNFVMEIGRVSDTLVVTASRGAESRGSVTQSVTVVTRADIQALGSDSLADVMRFVPGLSVEGTGREGALTSLFSRGGESDYNLVLIDGVRVNLRWRAVRLQPGRRRRDRARGGRARRAVVAVGIRCHGLGRAGVHQARRA